MNVDDELIRTQFQNNHWSLTLSSRFAIMLEEAQQQFGPRDASYSPAGIEFADTPVPYIWYWYPAGANAKYLIVRLPVNCANDNVQACYQLAHETVHFLSPTGTNKANILEEGAATLFATRYIMQNFGVPFLAGGAKYQEAEKMVEALLAIDAEAVRKVRKIQPTFSKITVDDLTKACACPPDLADQLLKSF